MFEKIVVGVDGSIQANNALDAACDLAKKYGSSLYLVHSPQVETTGLAVGYASVEIDPGPEEIQEAGKKVMDDATDRAKMKECAPKQCFVGNQDPADEILEAANTVDADLIVLGRRGLGGVASLVLGSVSQKVSHGAKVTCMAVHKE